MFKPKQQVVCISNQWIDEGVEYAPRPQKDEICTIYSIKPDNGFLYLREYDKGFSYDPTQFRAVQEVSQSECIKYKLTVSIPELLEIKQEQFT